MDDLNNPNRRISEASLKGDRIRTVTSTVKSSDPHAKCAFPRPLPGIIILVHGVNDIGEAYPVQAAGLCEGLNLRLGRKDLTPGTWDVERSCPAQRRATFERRAEMQGYNAIIPFYWGYRPVDKATFDADRQRYEEELRKRIADPEAPYDAYYIEGRSNPASGYQNIDCFGNRLDEHFCKNGGVFANATTNLIDMWGPGADIWGIVRWGSTVGDDNSHGTYANPHRIYYVLAAQRLANLILSIRANKASRDDTINVVAHSQGTLVTMLANFLIAADDSGLRPADCLIFNHSPYSLETPLMERLQKYGPQQSRRARRDTLANLCRLIDRHSQPGPDVATLVSNGVAHADAMAQPTHARDNHGKVFSYFCPHDRVVSLLNVQGIGWQGVPMDDAALCGSGFMQRIFMDGQALAKPPGTMPLPDIKIGGKGGPLTNRGVPSEVRDINAPQLPDFGYTFIRPGGCATLGGSDWGVNATGAAREGDTIVTRWEDDPREGIHHEGAIQGAELQGLQEAYARQGHAWKLISASKSPAGLRITRFKTEAEFMNQSAQTGTEISHHSAIVLDPNASRYATAFDLAIGQCKSYEAGKIDGGAFWQKLLRMADWRDSLEPDDVPYFQKGLLPRGIKQQMNKPPCIQGIVNESLAYIKNQVHCEVPIPQRTSKEAP